MLKSSELKNMTVFSREAQGQSDLFNICLHNDVVQVFDTRWHQVLLATNEMPP